MKVLVRLTILCTICFVAFLAAFAQDDGRGFTFHAGAGYTPLVGPISRSLDNGWNFQAGGGYMFTSRFGLIADYQYNGLGVPRSVLNQLAVPDGSAWLHSVTVGPEFRLAPASPISPYVVAGVGWYRRTIEFTQPTLATVTAFDPFFGFFFPAVVPANQVLGSITRNGFGGNVGAGFTIRFGSARPRLYAEARYHHASHARSDTQIVPFTVGIRW